MNNREETAPQQGHHNHEPRTQFDMQRRHNNEQSNNPGSNPDQPRANYGSTSSPPQSSTGHDDQAVLPVASGLYNQPNTNVSINMVAQDYSDLIKFAWNTKIPTGTCIQRMLEVENHRLKTQLQDSNSRINELTIYGKNQMTELNQLKGIVRKLESELEKRNRAYNSLHDHVQIRTAEVEKLREIEHHLQAEIGAKVEEINNLKEILGEKQAQLENMSKVCEVVKLHKSSLSKQLIEVQQQLQKKLSKIEILKDQVNQLTQMITYKKRKVTPDPIESDKDKDEEREVPNQGIPKLDAEIVHLD